MAKPAKQPASFDEALNQLETLIQTMERGELSLEEALTSYKQGIELMRLCQTKLADVEQQLKILDNDELKPLDLPNA